MKKVKLFALLIFLSGCSEKSYEKLDRFLGLKTEENAEVELERIGYSTIEKDSVIVFDPFKKTKFDSASTAKKAQKIKENVLGKPKKVKIKSTVKEGKSKKLSLAKSNRVIEALDEAKCKLREIYKESPQKYKPNTEKKSTKDTLK